MARRRGPEAFGNHHQLRLLPGADQAIGILMMGKVGAARPPDKADIREAAFHTVMLIRRPGVFQRFNDARDRDFFHCIGTARHAALH